MLSDDLGSVRDIVNDDSDVLNHIKKYNAFEKIANHSD